MLGTGTICYASDVGGILTLVTGWIHGEQKQVEAVDNGGPGYEFYKDGEDVPFMGGDGVAIDDDGSEIKLPAQDVMEVNSQYVEKKKTAACGSLITSFPGISRIFWKTERQRSL